MDWMQFLSGTPARDYVYQETPYEEQVRRAAGLLNRADAVLIGAGPDCPRRLGLSMEDAALRRISVNSLSGMDLLP